MACSPYDSTFEDDKLASERTDCSVDVAFDLDTTLPWWDASIRDIMAGAAPVADGTLTREDGVVSGAALEVTWYPEANDWISWHRGLYDTDPCWSLYLADLEALSFEVEGAVVVPSGTLSSALFSDGRLSLDFYADATGVSGTALEPPSGRDTVRLLINLTGAPHPTDPDRFVWVGLLHVDEPTPWSSEQEYWLQARVDLEGPAVGL